MSTYEPIASQTLGSAAASVTFSSIPQGYTDLVLVVSGRTNRTTGIDELKMQLNNDTGSNYSRTRLISITGSGSAYSDRASNETSFVQGVLACASSGFAASTFSPYIFNINNYSNTTTFKTVLQRYSEAQNEYGVGTGVGLYRSTSAITSVEFTSAYGSNFVSGSTFSLYGIQVGDKAQKAQGGNIVTTDGTYVYHTFTSSGAFIPSQALTVDYLVVAGGGAGGSGSGTNIPGGGGGAGGMRCTVTGTGGSGSLESALSLSAGKSYPVIIGAGGAAAISPVNGSDSVFGTITSLGGGGGGSVYITPTRGQDGGSGGGGAGANATAKVKGSGNSNQGFNGGDGLDTGNENAGGGGGASAAGATAGTNAGDGGAGRATSISGSSVTYAGGGGGSIRLGGSAGAGGAGGGATGVTSNGTGNAGTANTGGGGSGGKAAANNGGNGGSGIVIIRYLA